MIKVLRGSLKRPTEGVAIRCVQLSSRIINVKPALPQFSRDLFTQLRLELLKIAAILGHGRDSSPARNSINSQRIIAENERIQFDLAKKGSGAYIYTYPLYWHNHTNVKEKFTHLKIGSAKIITQRLKRQTTPAPEKKLLLAIFPAESELEAKIFEKRIQDELKSRGHKKIAGAELNVEFPPGSDWYETNVGAMYEFPYIRGLKMLTNPTFSIPIK
ncbi:MAG TPA: hypothetical protein DEP66_04155 [Acidimicrobiaceae bacterium]|nr:hypothetical protein [Acidimicrobiaceae bacterium]HCB37396.1 hypothetical protein [Acidimicrobiaceae bacterium]